MSVEYIPLAKIQPNPWQPRTIEDREHVLQLAESIKTHGLLQVPSGRRVQIGDGVELAFGHSRLAAYRYLYEEAGAGDEFATFPINIVDFTDRQMADAAAQENVSRKSLSAIEIGQAIQRYIADFGATQLEAGKVYGYSSQSSVSNLLRLLQLPEPVQAKVAAGELPERHARALIQIGRVAPQVAEKAAEAYVTAKDEDNAADHLRQHVRTAYDKLGVRMDGVAWDLAWPGRPIAVDKPKKDQPAEVPACRGCPFFVDGENAYWRRCLRPACFTLKGELHLQHALERASKKLGIPVLASDEAAKASLVDDGMNGMLMPEELERALKAKHDSLRLAPFVLKKDGYDYGGGRREKVTGYSSLQIVTVNAAALKRDHAKRGANASDAKVETDWQREQRLNKERKKKLERMVNVAAPHFAPLLPVSGDLLRLLYGKVLYQPFSQKNGQAPNEDEMRVRIMQALIAGHTKADAWNPPAMTKVHEGITELAHAFGVRLPAGWDAIEPAGPAAASNRTRASKGKKK